VIHHLHPMIYQRHGQGAALMVFKLLWTWLMVFPPAFLMGGTLPVIGQAVIRHASAFGSTTARLYAVNTLGAASGAFAAAFVFIPLLGIRLTCGAAMLASLLAGLLAFECHGEKRQLKPTPNLLESDAGNTRRRPARFPAPRSGGWHCFPDSTCSRWK
jgi:spermidine synthase